MHTPTISIIAAIGGNRELGKDNDLLWRIPADLRRLKTLTTGHPIIMGRKTYESIGRPLPGRTNIVITRDERQVIPGCIVVHSLPAALAEARVVESKEIFIFGGAAIYELALPYVDKLYLTEIAATDTKADVYFPEFKDSFVVEKEYPTESHEELTYQWVDYIKNDTRS